jgi:hypothetical protein
VLNAANMAVLDLIKNSLKKEIHDKITVNWGTTVTSLWVKSDYG